ncbi:MAG: hypothetical protein ACXQS3_02235 [Candidatus Methanofastidiosia archaeon]
MERQLVEELYIAVRPYLSNAHSVREFLDAHLLLQADEFEQDILKEINSRSGLEKTDFTILYTALKKMQRKK